MLPEIYGDGSAPSSISPHPNNLPIFCATRMEDRSQGKFF